MHDATAMRLQGLEGKVALVTGAGGGIGRRIVATLAAQGAQVAAADIAPTGIDGALDVTVDVTDEGSVDAGFRAVEEALGPVDVLVLNAGIFVIEPFEEVSLASWRRTLAVSCSRA